MNPSEKFLNCAVECQLVAKWAHTPEDKAVWIQMAERWLRCAELYDHESSAAHYAHLAKRHRAPARDWAHEGI